MIPKYTRQVIDLLADIRDLQFRASYIGAIFQGSEGPPSGAPVHQGEFDVLDTHSNQYYDYPKAIEALLVAFPDRHSEIVEKLLSKPTPLFDDNPDTRKRFFVGSVVALMQASLSLVEGQEDDRIDRGSFARNLAYYLKEVIFQSVSGNCIPPINSQMSGAIAETIKKFVMTFDCGVVVEQVLSDRRINHILQENTDRRDAPTQILTMMAAKKFHSLTIASKLKILVRG